MVTKTKELRVKEGRTELYVPHQESELKFAHPYAGPDRFVDVRNYLEFKNLRMPTASETASLVGATYDTESKDNKYVEEIISLMKRRWLWTNNSLLWAQKGVYIEDNPKIERSEVYRMNEASLRKRLESEDESVRFVPYGFKLEEQSPLELEKNDFVKALAGEEGAEKLARVADKSGKRETYVWGFNSIKESTQRVAALDFGCYNGRLYVDGYLSGGRYGCSFGVSD